MGEEFGLTDVVTPDVLRPLSDNESVQEQLEPHIPQTSDSVTDVLTSPQFQQALGVFGSALQSGQLGPLMSQFGMGQEVVRAANTGSMLPSVCSPVIPRSQALPLPSLRLRPREHYA